MNGGRATRLWVVGAFIGLAAFEATGQTGPAAFPPFIANTTTAENQVGPCVAIDDPGNPGVSAESLVLWAEFRGFPSVQLDLEGQRLDPVGGKILGEFDVTAGSNDEYESDVAGDGKGNYIIVWTGESGGVNSEIYGRFFDGSAFGSTFLVNSSTTGYQSHPSVARNANGGFVVVWESQPQIGGDVTIQAQRYNPVGNPVGPERLVNSTPGNPGQFIFNERPDVAIDDVGSVMIVWQRGNEIRGYRGNTNDLNAPPGARPPDLQLTSGSALSTNQADPHVAVRSSNDFLVVWEGQTTTGNAVFGRSVDDQGNLGNEFQISPPPVAAASPEVASAGDEFAVVWVRGAGRGEIFGRRVDSSFRPRGVEFDVTGFGSQGCPYPTLNCPNNPRVAANSLGNVLVAWEETDDAPPGGPYTNITGGIWGRRLELGAASSARIALRPAPVSVHAPQAVDNGVIEPGEAVAIEPIWKNTLEGTLTVTGTGSNLSGPAGGNYAFDDTGADYGSIAEGESTDCETATGNCYGVTISGSPRPATHWDASFLETLSNDLSKTWPLHIGESFTDVPTSQLFYRAIESVLHAGITTGCTATTYCPGAPVTRSQMSLFLARGVAGGGPAIPNSGTIGGNAYSCGAGGTSLLADVLPTDIFCRSVHYLAAQNVTSGCSATQYCPTPNVTRLEMGVFVARAVVAPGGGTAVPLAYGPDPVTNLSYSCDQANPNIHFTDVPASNSFCKHAHFLWAKGIISGCGATTYCPDDPVTRDAMARFLTNGFGVQLYGP